MAGPYLIDRVRETTTTTGTGTLTLAGAAAGFQAFSVVGDGNTCFYAIQEQTGNNWEVGVGTYTASGTTLARTTVLASSNSGSAVNFAAGTKDVFLTSPAAIMKYLAPTDTFANLAAVQAGRLNLPSDGFSLYRDSGTALVPWGPLYPCTAPVNGDFAWINQGSASVVTTNGGIVLQDVAGASTNIRLRKLAAPATPYTITALLIPGLVANINGYGLFFRESSSGKLHGLFMQIDGATGPLKLYSGTWVSATTFNATYVSQALYGPPPLFLRIADDGVNRICSISWNGQTWTQVDSQVRTDYLTANEVGYGVFSENATYAAHVTLLSWKQG